MTVTQKEERQKRVQFAVGMAAIDGGKPTEFTQQLLIQYTNGELSAAAVQRAIIEKYVGKLA